MFSEMTSEMRNRIQYLQKIGAADRTDGTERQKRLRQIPPETGKFLDLLASNCPNGQFIEIGTSAGYSSLWISMALKKGHKLRTFEILHEKVMLAKETFEASKVTDKIELIEGDFLKMNDDVDRIAFAFIDCEKEIYNKCFDILSNRLVSGGLIVADNAISHYDHIKPMIMLAETDNRFDTLTVPIAKGEFICRRK